MKTFAHFLEDIKNNRNGEMNQIREKGYSFNSLKYKFFDTFVVEYNSLRYDFSLFRRNNDVNFLIVEETTDLKESAIKKRSHYYSMSDLFKNIICGDKSAIILNSLLNKDRDIGQIIYKNNVYAFDVLTIKKADITKIQKKNPLLIRLFILLSLIQNKSNQKFGSDSLYYDGTYRFFYVYYFCRFDNAPMSERGWHIQDKCYNYTPFISLELIRLVFKGKTSMKDERTFSKELKNVNNNEEALILFIKWYNYLNKTFFAFDDIEKGIFACNTDALEDKEKVKCTNLKPYLSNKDTNYCYTANSVSLDVNCKSYLFLLTKFNKKYYLTEKELIDIINSDPSESSVYDRSEGSNS